MPSAPLFAAAKEESATLNFVGGSPAFLRARDLIAKYARCNATVLIQGETGTGKELAARALHYMSVRRSLPFVPINCGALPENLVESELFGHARGAFTDARDAKPGLIAQARGGTLFLDEIETMPPRTQVALLRFLQDKQFRPVGLAVAESADVRVICATNADLQHMVRCGTFRSDLLFRLDVLPLHMPSLRERDDDVLLLAQAFLDRLNCHSSEPPKVFSSDTAAILLAHSWPGNVRELENLVQRAFVLAFAVPVVRVALVQDDGAFAPRANGGGNHIGASFKVAKARAIAQFERVYFVNLLARTSGNVSLAARLSGKDRTAIGKPLGKYGLDRGQFSPRP